MSTNSNLSPARNSAKTKEDEAEMELGSDTSRGPVSSSSRRRGGGAPGPGPACSKTKQGTRKRSGSVSSSSSIRSSAPSTPAPTRRTRGSTREGESPQEGKARSRGKDPPTAIINLDESGNEDNSPEGGEPPTKKRLAGTGTDAEDEDDDWEKSSDGSKARGRGRKQTTGLYVGREKAVKRYNQQLKEQALLEEEKVIRGLSISEVFEKLEEDLDKAVGEMKNSPTPDVVNRARSCMGEVARVARSSKNLKGTFTKMLKHAAVIGSAAMDVLRTRLDSKESGDANLGQLKEIRRELDTVKREARANEEKARKEIAELREELIAAKAGMRETRGRRRRIVRDDDSPPRSPDRAEDRAEAAVSGDTTAVPEYDDERRRRQIMPPPNQIPVAMRPMLRGETKILDDGPVGVHGDRPLDRSNKRGSTTHGNIEEGSRGAVQTIMDQLTPMLEEWLRGKILPLDQDKGREGDRETDDRPATFRTQKDSKRRTDRAVPPGSGPGNPMVHKGGRQATTVPNRDLFNDGRNAAGGPEPQRRIQGTPPQMEEWRTVVGRKESRKKKKPPPTTAKPPSGGTGQRLPPGQSAGKGKGQKSNAAMRRRPPRTAAVTLTCPPNEYTEAMGRVRKGIDLKEIGIESLRPKRAVTGAIILEVPGPDGAERAETLRAKMATVLSDMEGVKVARPVKQGEMRLKRILESTTVQEIVRAISVAGPCRESEIQTGELRFVSPNGMGTLWVRGPLPVINKVVAARTLDLGDGWCNPLAEALEPRQLQCYKCLQRGHVQAVCPSQADRRDLCYRCGRGGHKARNCDNAPRCIICEEAGRTFTHRMGGSACGAPRKRAGPTGSGRQTATGGGNTEGQAPVADGDPESRPAVRGGPEHPDRVGAPVPVRPGQIEERMEVEEGEGETPAPPLDPPPMEQRPRRTARGVEAPDTRSPQ